jgi:hypothetical protein
MFFKKFYSSRSDVEWNHGERARGCVA